MLAEETYRGMAIGVMPTQKCPALRPWEPDPLPMNIDDHGFNHRCSALNYRTTLEAQFGRQKRDDRRDGAVPSALPLVSAG